jgi:hypothetical protein
VLTPVSWFGNCQIASRRSKQRERTYQYDFSDARFDHRSVPLVDDGEKRFDTLRIRKIIAEATVFGDQRSWRPT